MTKTEVAPFYLGHGVDSWDSQLPWVKAVEVAFENLGF